MSRLEDAQAKLKAALEARSPQFHGDVVAHRVEGYSLKFMLGDRIISKVVEDAVLDDGASPKLSRLLDEVQREFDALPRRR